jgi:hypothetical protein
VVHQPHRNFRDPRRPLGDLDAVEGVHVHQRQGGDVQVPLPAVQGLEDLNFRQAQLAVGDHQEVAAPAGRVEKTQSRKLVVKLLELPLIALDPLELLPQIIKEQRPHDLEDVPLAGVVAAGLAAVARLHDTLKQRAEDGRRDLRPVEPRTGQHTVTHVPVEIGKTKALRKQLAVDVREGRQGLLKIRLPLLRRRIEHGEEPG